MIKDLIIRAFIFSSLLINLGCKQKDENIILNENLTFQIKNTIELVRLTRPDFKILSLRFIKINENENYIKIQSEPTGLNTNKLNYLCLIDGIKVLIYPSNNKEINNFIKIENIQKYISQNDSTYFNDVYENVGYVVKIEKNKLIITNVIGHLTPLEVNGYKNIYYDEVIKPKKH